MTTDRYDGFYGALGRKVRQAREEAGLTQAQLARRLELTRSSIANLEAGRQRPPLHLLAELAAATGWSLPELLPDPALFAPVPAAPSVAREVGKLDPADQVDVMRLLRASAMHQAS